MTRRAALGITVLVILAGLALRLGPWHLPLTTHHYGGGILWGMMLYALAAAFRPRWWGRYACLTIAGAAAVCVELSRLVHMPALDAFRHTLVGQLLLGQIFSPWNLLAYAAGIAAMAVLVRPVVRPGNVNRGNRITSLDSRPRASDASCPSVPSGTAGGER
ncbi:hypothetical protein QO016_002228 [Methylobacterium persicinum]|uniref:DUF2809 domain-containing protein n=1 Tax=Methylobacterium persicinum TaxID=374426 RepID=A0ABU0HK99_9HYPH|nr:hypothetical protein [Methylobacterium persicinum]GJE37023.1 hypothetical protein KHHGKMAE_1078 [Methylobacterium persicinum]